MFAATRRWFRRNRTSLAVGAGTIGAVYLAGQYAWGKWLEARQRMGEDRIAKENLRRRFEQNQEDCTYTVLALLPTFRDDIIATLPAEDITAELQRQKQNRLARSSGPSEAASSEFPSAPGSVATTEDDRASLNSFQTGSYVHASQLAESAEGRPRKSKVQLWNDLKIMSITRSLTLLYTLSLLTLLTRIQLNLLGRRTYLSSVVSLATPRTQPSTISLENNDVDDDNYDNVYGNDFETNRKYLTFSWWLLHRGSKDIMQRVQAAVKDVFGPVNPRDDITLERLSHLILDVRKKVEGSTETERREHKWLTYLLPPRDQEDFVLQESGMDAMNSPNDPLDEQHQPMSPSSNPSLRRLLDETSDLIDSPTFTHVLTLLLNATFSHLIDQRIAAEAFKVVPATTPSRIEELDAKCKVAQTLAVFCRQAHVIAAGSSEADELAAVTSEAGTANEYLAKIDAVRDLEGFAAVIYSSNFEFEAVEDEDGAAPVPRQPATVQLPVTAQPPVASDQPVVHDEIDKTHLPGLNPEAPAFENAWEKALAKEGDN
ncbi:Peroxin-3 [Delphinella strobiligena]|nr:Peroxin-3 [Delphinella strobiligena]